MVDILLSAVATALLFCSPLGSAVLYVLFSRQLAFQQWMDETAERGYISILTQLRSAPRG